MSCNTTSHERDNTSDLAKEMTVDGPHGQVKFVVEIAATDEQRARGLMWRMSLAENHGMLFVFDVSSRHSIWMKNTYLPLDLIFFDEQLNVVGIIENAQPLNEQHLTIDKNSRFVLEVLAGTVKKHRINLHSKAKVSY